jgi:tRNA threonylcarbamoyladenosine biosynthesis protein TsaE
MMSSAAQPSLLTCFLADPAATTAFAGRLAPLLRPADVVALWGDLGAGKSLLARGVIQALSADAEEVPSPTFTLVQTYPVALPVQGQAPLPAELWHFDLYRLTTPDQAYDLAIEEAFQEGISLIEWPDRLGYLLPQDRLDIHLENAGDGRQLRLAGNAAWAGRLAALDLTTGNQDKAGKAER